MEEYTLSNLKFSSIDDLHKYVSDEDIFTYYIGPFECGTWFTSPFRPHESKPSFKIDYYNGRWVWVDYAKDKRPASAIDFVKQYFNINFYDALTKVYNEVYLQGDGSSIRVNPQPKNNYSRYFINNGYKDFELAYWDQAKIDINDLKYFKVYTGAIRFNGRVVHDSIINDPYFIYMFSFMDQIYKGYRPYATIKELKFFAHNTINHVQGLDLIPNNGLILIITKSYKDVIVWYKLGYPAIAPHSENDFISEEIINDLKKRFKYIYVNYDNDDIGVSNSIERTKEYKLNYFNLPINTNKDPFEFVVDNNYRDLNYLFNEKLIRDNCMI